MGTLKWYKRDPKAALHGMMGLSLEERGAYNTVLDLIYIHDGALVDDARHISLWLAVKPKTWKRLRARLLDCGKLYVHAGCLHNEKADQEAGYALSRIKQTSLAALNRWSGPKKIKGLVDADAYTTTTTKKDFLSLVPPKK